MKVSEEAAGNDIRVRSGRSDRRGLLFAHQRGAWARVAKGADYSHRLRTSERWAPLHRRLGVEGRRRSVHGGTTPSSRPFAARRGFRRFGPARTPKEPVNVIDVWG